MGKWGFVWLVIFMTVQGVSAAEVLRGVPRVIDGDTYEVAGERIRLFGVDTPEVDQTCTNKRGVDWHCGAWVSAQVRDLLAGLRLSCSAVERDRYGRLVARCEVAGQDLGARLVREGWAFAYRRYSMDYDLDEKTALVQKRGLHAHVLLRPEDHRRAAVAAAASTAGAGCQIKGNISRNGNRIYHMPGQRDYARTVITPAKGERVFCSEQEARAAGWRAARR